MATMDLQALATLPGEPKVTLGELLEFSLSELDRGSVEDAKNLLLEFQRIARGGAPRVAKEEGAR